MTATDLDAARKLAAAGVPLFMAEPDATQRTGYRLPMQWERGAVANPALVDALPEGWALCAVMGHGLDLIDLDPRSGGELPTVTSPVVHAWAETPSGGRHLFISSLGLPSRDGIWPGVDYKGGDAAGRGRGFAFIAPTVRVSKSDGQPRPYRWRSMNLAIIGQPDDRSWELRQRITDLREVRAEGEQRTIPRSVARREWEAAVAALTNDLIRWKAAGWGGEAHAGLLRHTTHLARLSPDHAALAYVQAFRAAGVNPDDADMAKLDSALASAVPDIVVNDAELSPSEVFWLGGAAELPPKAEAPTDPAMVEGGAFDFCDPSWLASPPEPPQAAYGALGGPAPLFYAEGVHWLQGESESGKTWVALAVVLEVLRSGGAVLVVDHEDTRDGLLARLRDLGVLPAELARLVYVSGHDVSHLELTTHLELTDRDYALVLVDGVTSALSAAGLSGRDEQEVTRWADAVPRRARMAIVVDHVVKDVDNRGGMAIGSQAKKSVVTGTSFEVRCTTKFGRGTTGVLELRLQKDKRGGVRGSARAVTRLRVASDPVTGSVTISASPGAPAGSPSAGLFLGADLPAEAEVRAAQLAAVLQADGANPDLSGAALIRRLRDDLNQSGKAVTMRRAVHLFKHAAGKPVDISVPPVDRSDET